MYSVWRTTENIDVRKAVECVINEVQILGLSTYYVSLVLSGLLFSRELEMNF